MVPSSTLHVMFFAKLRERAPKAELNFTLPQNGVPLAELPDFLMKWVPDLKDVFGVSERIYVAVNHELTHRNRMIKNGDVVAYFPPMTGG